MENIRVVVSTGKGSNKLYPDVIAKVEKSLIEKALEEALGNQSLAAKKLGINRNTLHSKIKKYNIQLARYKI